MRSWQHTWPVAACACAVVAWFACSAAGPDANGSARTMPVDLFEKAAVIEVRVELKPEAVESLRKDPRAWVFATVTDNTGVYPEVSVHLKGATGSFQPVDERPSLTLDFCRSGSERKFRGLRRIHLNNSVEDPSLLNEKLASVLFLSAGVPCPRVAHARLKMNGRELGLYVLKEGFTEDFLAWHFRRIGAGLYEPKDGHDVDQELYQLSIRAGQGRGDQREPQPPGVRSDASDAMAEGGCAPGAMLRALAAAVGQEDPARRFQALERVVDVNRFLTFMAMEVMLGHRDGYCLARNNFRVYCDPEKCRVLFFPQGMDQLLGTPDLPWKPSMAGLVAQAVLNAPGGEERYRACFTELFTNVFKTEVLAKNIDELVTGLRPSLSFSERARLSREADSLKERLALRRRSLEAQLSERPLAALEFSGGHAELSTTDRWTPSALVPGVSLDRVTGPGGVAGLHIAARSEATAAWKRTVLLPRGRYQFEGRSRVAGFQPLPFGRHQGAALRVGGMLRQTEAETSGQEWKTLRVDFEITQAREETELICELRARAGEAWFDSLRISQLPANSTPYEQE